MGIDRFWRKKKEPKEEEIKEPSFLDRIKPDIMKSKKDQIIICIEKNKDLLDSPYTCERKCDHVNHCKRIKKHLKK